MNMLSQLTVLMHKIGDRAYHLFCDPNSPLEEVRSSLSEFAKMIDKIEEDAKAKKEADSQTEEVKDGDQ
jgi:hypothetical protein